MSDGVTHKLAREIGFDCQDANVAQGVHICCCQTVSRTSCLLVSAITGVIREKSRKATKHIAAGCSTCEVLWLRRVQQHICMALLLHELNYIGACKD